jgi:DHA1 family bicyclomycin/chloramphenicol resistance-like MFS transporter
MSRKEFLFLIASLMSIGALAIDAMLPALPNIVSDFGLPNRNHGQYVISVMFIGIGVGTILFGPASDSFGRRPMATIGLAIYGLGTIVCILSNSFFYLLIGRFLEGAGVGCIKVINTALVRDKYSGAEMAKIMSVVVSIFVIVPAIAPSIGQLVLMIGKWRHIFLILLAMGSICLVWFRMRQPETLPLDKRKPFTFQEVLKGLGVIIKTKRSLCFSISSGIIFGGFLGYLTSCQQIYDQTYHQGQYYSLYFGFAAILLGMMSFFNSKLVDRYGMIPLARTAMFVIFFASLLTSLLALSGFYLTLPYFLVYITLVFAPLGVLFGNLNSIAMEPLGEIAGLASSFLGSMQTFVSVSLGVLIGQLYDGTILNLTIGFCVTSLMCILVTNPKLYLKAS